MTSFRGTKCFRSCVAREEDTPLTELHIMQPVLGALLFFAVVCTLLTTLILVGLLPLEGLALRSVELVSVGLAASASAGLVCVGRIASHVPTHEQLNVALKEGNTVLGGSVGGVQADAADAEQLQSMTLGWVKERSAERDGVRQLHAQLRTITHELWAFRFKATLLRYMARGEMQRFQHENAQLLLELRETSGATIAQYETARRALLPNGRLTLAETRRIADVVRQTEQDSAYDFLDEVIYALCDDFDALAAAEDGAARTRSDFSYAELVDAVYKKAAKPPYSTRFAAFARHGLAAEGDASPSSALFPTAASDGDDDGMHTTGSTALAPAVASPPLVSTPGTSPSSPGATPGPRPPSPPPSPPAPLSAAGRGACAIGVFVYIETHKPRLLRTAWKLGVLTGGVSAMLIALSVTADITARVVSVGGALTATAAALVGWWVCNNKKDDRVMQLAVDQFQSLLGELNEAERKLRAALDTMIACDVDMSTLADEIARASGAVQQQLDTIRAHNQRTVRGTRRSVLDAVLVRLADVDASMAMGPTERRKLLILLSNMTDHPPHALASFYAALKLQPPSPPTSEQQRAARGVVAGDDAGEFSTKEVLDVLEDLGAFELILGLDDSSGGQQGRGGGATRAFSPSPPRAGAPAQAAPVNVALVR